MSKNIFTGFKIPEDTLAKVKYIAWYDRVTLTNMVVESFHKDIAKFEKRNGPITEEQIKKSVKSSS